MNDCVLGISAYYHDSAAAVVRAGQVLAAAQEERFSRRKHDPRFPASAVNYCLEEAFVEGVDLDAIVFYDDPLLTLDRAVKNSLMGGDKAARRFKKAALSLLGHKLWIEKDVRRAVGSLGKRDELLVVEHHMAHAASAFYPSPYAASAIVTLDGVGEWATTTVGVGEDERIDILEEIGYPHSLGLLYSAFTYFTGFKVNSGEYKLMGLAPYGVPRYYDRIREHVIDLRPDGSFRLNTDYFGFLDGEVMTNEKFDALFEGTARTPETALSRREMDLASSIQKVTEDAVLALVRHALSATGSKHVCLAGGVALNCVANGRVQREVAHDGLWIQPAAGDAGGALGAALAASHQYLGVPRHRMSHGRDSQQGSYLGPRFSGAEVRAFLDRYDYPYECVPDLEARATRIAEVLAQGRIVGYFAGRMEYGPRALGARSILGDPRDPDTQTVMNLKIKFRESFRPFAPSVLAGEAGRYFELDGESPYMLLVADLQADRRKPFDLAAWQEGTDDIGQIVNRPRSDVPAVTHVDFSARVQTVGPDEKPDYHAILCAFQALTGCGVLVNTSFNVRGEPIVCSPDDAYACFMRTDIDLLVLEDCLLWKEGQPASADSAEREVQLELD